MTCATSSNASPTRRRRGNARSAATASRSTSRSSRARFARLEAGCESPDPTPAGSPLPRHDFLRTSDRLPALRRGDGLPRLRAGVGAGDQDLRIREDAGGRAVHLRSDVTGNGCAPRLTRVSRRPRASDSSCQRRASHSSPTLSTARPRRSSCREMGACCGKRRRWRRSKPSTGVADWSRRSADDRRRLRADGR